MISPAPLPPATTMVNELAQAKQKLVHARTTLIQVCRDLEAQIETLENLSAPANQLMAKPTQAAVKLFEAPPANVQQLPTVDVSATSGRIIKASAPAALDPDLEQATLEELNAALSKAFAQIASRSPW